MPLTLFAPSPVFPKRKRKETLLFARESRAQMKHPEMSIKGRRERGVGVEWERVFLKKTRATLPNFFFFCEMPFLRCWVGGFCLFLFFCTCAATCCEFGSGAPRSCGLSARACLVCEVRAGGTVFTADGRCFVIGCFLA